MALVKFPNFSHVMGHVCSLWVMYALTHHEVNYAIMNKLEVLHITWSKIISRLEVKNVI